MAAFRARRFVWLAISEITWMISLICCELVRIRPIASTDFCTAAPPRSASALVCLATLSASAALPLTASIERVSCFDGGAHFLDARTLRLGPLGEALRAFGDDPRPFGELGGALGDLADEAREIGEHLAQSAGQFVDGLVALDLDLPSQIAFGRGGHDGQQFVDLAAQGFGLLTVGFGAGAVFGGLFFLTLAFGLGRGALRRGLFLLALAFGFEPQAFGLGPLGLELLFPFGGVLDLLHGLGGGVDGGIRWPRPGDRSRPCPCGRSAGYSRRQRPFP